MYDSRIIENNLNLLNPSDYLMCHQVNIQKFYILPTNSMFVYRKYPKTKSDIVWSPVVTDTTAFIALY
jgi:hypothetical protein